MSCALFIHRGPDKRARCGKDSRAAYLDTMEKTMRTTALHAPADDRVFWRSRSPRSGWPPSNSYAKPSWVPIMLSKDFKEFVAGLKGRSAEYMIVGGYVVWVHGYPRNTGDLDIWLNPTPSNARRVLKAVTDLGSASLGLTEGGLTKEGNVIRYGQPPLRIDLLTAIDGVSFTACFGNRKEVTFDGLTMNFIGYDDLVTDKRASGRHRDLDDVENMVPPEM